MANPEFKYAPMFQLGPDKTEYRLLTKEGVSVGEFEGKEILKVTPEALTRLAMPKPPLRACFHSAKTPAPLLFTAKRDSKCGLALKMKKHSHWACTTRLLKTTCATHKMRLSTCTTR